ncbi:MAG: Fic family protein [Acidimicrobiales bacterium]
MRATMGPAGTEVQITWQGRRAHAFVPELLANRDLELDAKTVARTAVAASEAGHAAEALDPDSEALARLLLRSEGVASSYIESIRAPVVDVVLAEEQVGRQEAGAAAWVAANLAAVIEAVATASTRAALSLEILCDWHRTLMTGSPTPERYVGKVREEQGWIGGTSPFDAALVTPPPGELDPLIDDLLAFVNRVDVDPVAQAAVAHAQFEIIHPFGDGNGRVGRVLVAWILTRRLGLLVPPPVSVAIAADVGGYTSGLTLFRLGDHSTWVRWFAEAVTKGGEAQRSLITRVEELRRQWAELLARSGARKVRSDAALFSVLDLMPRHLVFTTPILERELGISRRVAGATLRRLADAEILTEYGTVAPAAVGQPAALYVSRDLLGLAGSSPLR